MPKPFSCLEEIKYNIINHCLELAPSFPQMYIINIFWLNIAKIHSKILIKIRHFSMSCCFIFNLSYDVASESKITPYNKINKLWVVYRFTGNVMTSITTLLTYWQNSKVFTTEMNFQSNLNVIWLIESNICALVLLNILNSLPKRNKMLGKPRILSLFPNSFNKFNKTWALM